MHINHNHIYHGTNLFSAKLIDQHGVWIYAQREATDFGRGYYLTDNLEQAMDWAQVRSLTPQISRSTLSMIGLSMKEFQHHPDTKVPALLQYRILPSELMKLNGLVFPLPSHPQWPAASKVWHSFVTLNRKGINLHSFDYVFGPVSKNKVSSTGKLDVFPDKNQLSLHTESSLQCLADMKIFTLINPPVEKEFLEISSPLAAYYKFIKDRLTNKSRISPVFSFPSEAVLEEPPSYWADLLNVTGFFRFPF
ncbi:hypothetical protein AB685_14380 [Bacillus sp. LL01]|uniref:DUF3990 domain-containing protein n=1 Tax=Bacillus sp. LL01 TaxID=1665556 RepID=UPI00064D37CB|nr:DUF3990 domain-containing protein [Bacillus sp. LL01]KMJ58004.1 hypothetical protein AB685_14380 [Bacillus sp. LL01]